MKKLLTTLALFIIVIFSSKAQWQQTSLDSNSVHRIVINGNNIFAGTDDGIAGIYLSTNNGANWSQMNNGFPMWSGLGSGYESIESMTIKGDTLLAGTFNPETAYCSLCLSTNNASNWDTVNIHSCLGERMLVSALALKGGTIFAGTWGSGIRLSVNNGSSWSIMNTGLLDTTISALAIKGDSIFAGTHNGGGVFLSTNNAGSWTAINNGFPTNIIVYTLLINGNNIYAGTNSGVYLSSNNGSN